MENKHTVKRFAKSKKGSTLPFSAGILFVGVILLAIIVDIGTAYLNHIKTQHICDAAVISGAEYAKHGYFSVADQGNGGIPPKRAIIKDNIFGSESAETKARDIINKNKNNYPEGTFTMDSIEFNPTDADPQGRTPKDQYYNGDFTVRIKGRSSNILSNFLQGFFKIEAESKAHASPQ